MTDAEGRLGAYLRSRRSTLEPLALGYPAGRRRTPGLRREEVAQRAGISPTWYAWLEQGRGGAPSADTLDRIAAALMLTEAEREHLFLIGLGRAPDVRYRPGEGITPRLQGVLDAMPWSPAIIKTATWDVVAWNRAAIALNDYGALPPRERNVLRLIFRDSRVRAAQDDWWSVARFVVATFRADAARAGAGAEMAQLAEELSRESAEFATLWRGDDVAAPGGGVKRLNLPEVGGIDLEFSTFAVSGRSELALVVYNAATEGDASRLRRLIEARAENAGVA
ncbi:helix-turn-helix transcriptional regulator [Brevundimonas sp.]|uniref:helix-turn-helix transcriptional regulator n=1 Tax=Brevundimonas sp. TaxID=1871086 RepID=UPI001832233D|nr:helix-turn-helix transcriptional regulator [Brevundimonas sp.]MBA4806445.1 helix-turn-helix domain-containing protein [Brevundimonas sp.]